MEIIIGVNIIFVIMIITSIQLIRHDIRKNYFCDSDSLFILLAIGVIGAFISNLCIIWL